MQSKEPSKLHRHGSVGEGRANNAARLSSTGTTRGRRTRDENQNVTRRGRNQTEKGPKQTCCKCHMPCPVINAMPPAFSSHLLQWQESIEAERTFPSPTHSHAWRMGRTHTTMSGGATRKWRHNQPKQTVQLGGRGRKAEAAVRERRSAHTTYLRHGGW